LPAPDIALDFALAEAAVREAGTLARAHFSAAPKSWKKDDDSPVSEADKAVDGLLKRRLAGARPDYGWLSEETADAPDRLARDRVWIVDPIDGTRAFLDGQDVWVISVALIENGAPVIGLIYNPMREQMFTAIAGGGATLNGEPIKVSAKTDMADCRLLANAAQMKHGQWTLPWPKMNIQRYNALAYRVVTVAAGRHDAALTFSRFHEWDIAAAGLILAEAGGVLTTFEGEPFAYNKAVPKHECAIAANPALHAAFAAFVARSRKSDPSGM